MSEISRHISQQMSVISDLFLQCTTYFGKKFDREILDRLITEITEFLSPLKKKPVVRYQGLYSKIS